MALGRLVRLAKAGKAKLKITKAKRYYGLGSQRVSRKLAKTGKPFAAARRKQTRRRVVAGGIAGGALTGGAVAARRKRRKKRAS